LFLTLDLDPLYEILYHAKLPESIYKRWLLAYWIIYSPGECCKIACESGYDNQKFWEGLLKSKTRGAERRHMRNKHLIATILHLKERFIIPEKVVDFMITNNAESTFFRAKEIHGFGDWIAWKICDMLESLGFQDSYLDDISFVYKSALEGKELFCDYLKLPTNEMIAYLEREFPDKARPREYRNKSLPEWETCWCKFASKTYWIGKDTHDIYESLRRFSDNKISEKLIDSFKAIYDADRR